MKTAMDIEVVSVQAKVLASVALELTKRFRGAPLDLGSSERVLIQRGLTSLGMDTGPADGLFGRRTREAVRSWQASKGLEQTGYLTREQADALIAVGRTARRRAGTRTEQQRLAEFCAEVPQSALCTKQERARAERQRLAEFCAEVPQSALCRDL